MIHPQTFERVANRVTNAEGGTRKYIYTRRRHQFAPDTPKTNTCFTKSHMPLTHQLERV